jgi:hypothetical protein
MGRRVRAAVTLLGALTGCGAEAVSVTVANKTERDLRCLLVFGHWVTMDVPVIAPGGAAAVDIRRAADGALHVPRAGDGRPMMLEALHCGYDEDWSASLVKLGWQPVMASERREFVLTCAPGAAPVCAWE